MEEKHFIKLTIWLVALATYESAQSNINLDKPYNN